MSTNQQKIAELGNRVLRGGHIDQGEALWLFGLENTSDIFDLMSWANRIREKFKGNKIHADYTFAPFRCRTQPWLTVAADRQS